MVEVCVWDSEELVDREPSPIAPSGLAGACRGEIEVESDVTVLLLQGQRMLVNDREGLGSMRGGRRGR